MLESSPKPKTAYKQLILSHLLRDILGRSILKLTREILTLVIINISLSSKQSSLKKKKKPRRLFIKQLGIIQATR